MHSGRAEIWRMTISCRRIEAEINNGNENENEEE